MSEIIGNLLILGITVTLFSSVLWFVTSMPPPKQEVYTDFSATTEIQPGGKCWINVTNQGGQVLDDFKTKIYIFVNEAPKGLNFSDSAVDIGPTWVTGETWVYDKLTGVIESTKLSISIIDYVANSMIWSSVLLGENGDFPPIIGEKGIGPSPTYDGDQIRFYASVMDPDGNLRTNSVFLDASSIGISSPIHLTDTNNDGLFVSAEYTASSDWNNKIVLVNATDQTDRESTARMTITNILRSPVEGGGGGGGLGSPPGNLNYSGLQGINIFELSDWKENNYSAEPRTSFTHGQKAVVVVASKYLVNTDTLNQLLVTSAIDSTIQTKVSSPNVLFYRYDYNSGYYVYNVTIDTGNLADNMRYIIQAQLKDTWVPNNIFFATLMISLGGQQYPSILTYSDSSFQTISGKFYSSEKIYVEIMTNYDGTWDQMGGDIEIRDFFWHQQLKRIPAYNQSNDPESNWNGPVSNLWTVSKGLKTAYRLTIDLSKADQDPWIPGSNYYALRYDVFKAGNETYTFSKMINITAPKVKMDILAGTDQSSGNAWGLKNYMNYYKNDNNWYPPELTEKGDEGSGNKRVMFVELADVNNDEKTDIVAVINYVQKPDFGALGWYTYWYINDGGWTRKMIATTGTNAIKAIAVANIDYDNDLDVIVGLGDRTVGLFRNDGLWTYSQIGATPNNINSLKAVDMTKNGTPGNDPIRSLDVVVGCDSGIVVVFKNNNNIGTSWSAYTRSSTTTSLNNYANSDIPQNGSVTGTYASTTGSYNPLVYEQLTEIRDLNQVTVVPTLQDSARDNTGDEITQLQIADGIDYTTDHGKTAYVVQWDPTDLTDGIPILTASLNVKYKTRGAYDSEDWVCLGLYDAGNPDQWPLSQSIQITPSANYVVKGFSLDGIVTTKSQAIALIVMFNNSDPDSDASVDFDFLSLNITTRNGPSILDHQWTIPVTSASAVSHTFCIRANITVSSDTEGFAFWYYSTAESRWIRMLTALNSTTIEARYLMPQTITGVIYVKVNDTNRLTGETLDFVRIYQMYILTNVTTSGSIGTVRGLEVANMDSGQASDYGNDIVLVDVNGFVWVALMDSSGNVLNNFNKKNPASQVSGTVVGLVVGRYIGAYGSGMDVAVASYANALGIVTFFEQNTPGNYLKVGQLDYPLTKNGEKILVIVSGDVNGDGRDDILISTSDGYIGLFIGYGGTLSSWQTFLVDRVLQTAGSSTGVPVNCLSIAKVQGS